MPEQSTSKNVRDTWCKLFLLTCRMIRIFANKLTHFSMDVDLLVNRFLATRTKQLHRFTSCFQNWISTLEPQESYTLLRNYILPGVPLHLRVVLYSVELTPCSRSPSTTPHPFLVISNARSNWSSISCDHCPCNVSALTICQKVLSLYSL